VNLNAASFAAVGASASQSTLCAETWGKARRHVSAAVGRNLASRAADSLRAQVDSERVLIEFAGLCTCGPRPATDLSPAPSQLSDLRRGQVPAIDKELLYLAMSAHCLDKMRGRVLFRLVRWRRDGADDERSIDGRRDVPLVPIERLRSAFSTVAHLGVAH
jgi:hypothetical protein